MDRIRLTKKSSTRGVLFLQGVYKRDCKRVEDIFQDRLLSDDSIDQKTYDKIPTVFTDVESWPTSTNLLCWFCHSAFEDHPWFEPQSIEPNSVGNVGKLMTTAEQKNSVNDHKIKIVPKGVFCSCNCVRAYINLTTTGVSRKHDKVAMLKYVYELFEGKCIPDIQPSPEPTEMIQYGGRLTALAYKKTINDLDAAYMHELDDNNFASICNVYLSALT